MKFDKVKDLEAEKFRRLTGVKRTTFDKMVVILGEAYKAKKHKGGRSSKLKYRRYAFDDSGIHRRIQNVFSYK